MATQYQRVYYDQFDGDWLAMGATAAENNMFSGHNVHVYENGTVGERPGWEEITWTNKPAGTKPLKGITWFKGTSTYGELVVAYEDGANIDIEQWTMVNTGAISATADTATVAESQMPDPPSVFEQSWPGEKLFPMFTDTSQVIGVGSRLYEDFSATSYTANLGSGYASGSLVYRDRAFYWGFDNYPGRVYYSDAAVYGTVQASSYFDVSALPDVAAQGVIGMWNVRDALLIARRDGIWMAMFGTNPTDGSLREIGHGVVPHHGISVADMDNQLWFMKPHGAGVVVVTPSGLDVDTHTMARPGREAGVETNMPLTTHTMEPIRGIADVICRCLLLPYLESNVVGAHDTVWFLNQINGRWIQESFTLDANINEIDFAMMDENTVAMVIRDDTPAYRMFTRRISLDRPARDTGDNFVNQVSNETTPTVAFALPEIPSPPGQQWRVRQVLVDVDYWQQTTEFDAPSFDVQVQARGVAVSGTGTQELALTTVSIDGSSWPDTAGTNVSERRRAEATFTANPYAASSQIRIANMVSVAVQAITVILDVQDTPRS